MSDSATVHADDDGGHNRAVWRSTALDGPNEDDAAACLRLDNPWWTAGAGQWRPHCAHWPRRGLFDRLFNHLHRTLTADAVAPSLPVVVTGPRCVGKTVLLRQAVARLMETGVAPQALHWIDAAVPALSGWRLDELASLALAAGGGGGQEGAGPVFFIDHAEHRPDWLAGVRRLRARYPGAVIVAASSLQAVDDGSAGLSAGLTAFTLPPVGFAEYLGLTGLEAQLVEPMRFGGRTMYSVADIAALDRAFLAWINGGGFPQTVLLPPAGPGRPEDGGELLRRKVTAAWLAGDIPVRHGIASPTELQALLVRLARNTGGEMSIEGLAEACGLAKNTTRRYVEFLEQAGMVWRMPRLHPSGRRFDRMRTFKLHLTSPCLYAGLFGPVGADDPVLAALTETAVVAQWQGAPERETLHFARLPEGAVDLIGLERSDEESRGAARPAWACALVGRDESLDGCGIDGLIAFSRRNPGLRWLGATTRSKAALRNHSGLEVWHRPASQYCYEVGKRL